MITVVLFIYNQKQTSSINHIESPDENLKESIQGDRDNPEAANTFRYEMIQSNQAGVNIREKRQSAVDYIKANMSGYSPRNGVNFIFNSIGPGNIGGRIRSIIIHPVTPNSILIGSVSGGVWKTTNGGANWSAKMTSLNPLTIGCMVIDPNNNNTVYAGTGEGWGNADAVFGGGIYKSTDFGETWNLLSTTNNFSFTNVMKMAIDAVTGKIYAGTKAFDIKQGIGSYTTAGGLFTSTDAGTTWVKDAVLPFTSNYFNPADIVIVSSGTVLFATGTNGSPGGIFRTSNNGSTWTQMTSGLPSTGYGRIAMTKDPGNANTIYAVFANGSPGYGLNGIFKSTNGGQTWSALTSPGTIASTGSTYLSNQGWYDNYIAVDSKNSSNIFVGGVEIMKSTNGGNNWSQLTYWNSIYGSPVVHSDHHVMAFDPGTANLFYEGNDGGIYKSTNSGANGSWSALNNGLAITQIYSGAVSATGNVVYVGCQDNGQLKYSGTGLIWNTIYGGDGGYTAVDQTNSNINYEEYVYLDIRKTTDGGSTWKNCQTGLTDAGSSTNCLFISPFSMDLENSNVLIAGSTSVWVTGDGASTWKQSSNVLSTPNYVSAVTIVNATVNYLGFAGTTDGKVFKSTNINTSIGSKDTWRDITPTGNNGAWVRRISVETANKNNIYACYSGYNASGNSHVWYSSNQGTNWTNISGNLPNVPVHSLVVDPTAVDLPGQTLYIGTETGIYITSNRGTNWAIYNSGMPPYEPVSELVIQSGTNQLYAFSYGGGTFSADSPLPVELISFTSSVDKNSVELRWVTAKEINNKGFAIERTISGVEDWKQIAFVDGKGNSNSPVSYSYTDYRVQKGAYKYRLKQIDYNGNFQYLVLNGDVVIGAPFKFSVSQNYPNPFNPTTKIDFNLPFDGQVSVKLYDVTGREIKALLNENKTAGYYTVAFDATGFSSGIYFYHIKSGKFSDVKRMIILK
ncbi:T9SS C-terminal target domain-containing protein [bacterium]|nr:MAG: T9SS C-terminal target domain-containing protein [bacterium]